MSKRKEIVLRVIGLAGEIRALVRLIEKNGNNEFIRKEE